MKLPLAVALSLLGMMAPNRLSAASLTGREFTALCASLDQQDQRACGMGFAAVMALTLRERGYGDVQYCYRGPNSDEELRRSFVASMASHEDRNDLPFIAAILFWLRDAFPCS